MVEFKEKEKRGFFVVKDCLGWYLSTKPSDGHTCPICGETEWTVGYTDTVIGAVMLVHQLFTGDNEIDLFDDDDMEDFMHTLRQVVKRWNQ